MRRQAQGVPYGPDQKVAEGKPDDQKQRKEVERDLGSPWVENKQRVATVSAQGEGKRDCQRREHENPEEPSHCAARSRGAL
jgi:hypothetical protein